eukprot:NODE_14110_length_1128_cov_1.573427.p10 GENE.NODE_14110_length_1128_cov_1.573427~~NODE_14110_length_1128_cov_1.573427.p10  ORF type:complete len:56 (-),score=22.89 NODE_14110_length_1128_cov_1.573427:466-633(-)
MLANAAAQDIIAMAWSFDGLAVEPCPARNAIGGGSAYGGGAGNGGSGGGGGGGGG